MNAKKPSDRLPLGFFVLVFALSAAFWLIGAVTGQRLPLPMDLPVSALMVVCPITAAVIFVRREDGRGGIKKFFRRVFDLTGITPKIWYAPVILLMPVVLLLSYGAMRVAGLPLPEPEIPFLTIPVLFVVFFVAGVAEEAGWMGYAVEPMLGRWGALKAAVVLGLVWSLWHIVPLVQSHRSLEWIGWWCVGTVAQRVLIVWLYNNTGKSVMAASLFHAMSNVSDSLFPNGGSHYDPAVTGVILAVAALIVTLGWGPRTLARHRIA